MSALALLAWRNVWRNKRRTALTILAVAFGIWLIVVMRGLQFGSYAEMVDTSVKRGPGHLQVQRKGYWDEKTLRHSFPLADADTAAIRAIPCVAHLSPKLAVDALVGVGDENTTGAQIVGVVPSLEQAMTVFGTGAVVEGRFLTDQDTTGVVIGRTMATNLRAKLGDELAVFTQARDGSMAATLLTITAIFHTGEQGMDGFVAICHIALVQETLVSQGRATAIAVTVDDVRNLNAVKRTLDEMLRTGSETSRWDVLGYDRLMPALSQSIAFDDASGVVFLILLLVVIAFGILNTILMSVMERYHEFGVMMGIGMKPRLIAGLVVIESLFVSGIGLVLGNVAGYATNAWWQANPVRLESAREAYELYGFDPVLVAVPDLAQQATWTVVILALTILVALWPAWVAMRFRPVEAIRHV